MSERQKPPDPTAAKPARQDRDQQGRAKKRLLLEGRLARWLLAAGVVTVLYVIAMQPPLGVPGEHVYPYHPGPRIGRLPLLLVLALPLAAGVAMALRGRRRGLALAALICGSLLLRAGAATAPRYRPGASLLWPFLWQNTEGAYAVEAPRARRPAAYLRGSAERLDVSADPSSPDYDRIHHADVHPPGIALGFVAVEALYDAAPALARRARAALESAFPSLVIFRRGRSWPIRHPLVVAATLAALTIGAASLAPLFAFLAARRLGAPGAAPAAAALAAVVPGTCLFNPSIDQAYPSLTFLLVWLAASAAVTRRLAWGAALGAAFYVALFIHVGYGLVAVILGAAGLLAWRAERPQWRLRDMARLYERTLGGAVLGFVVPALALRLAFGYSTLRVIGLCLRNNARFNAMVGRSYAPWLAAVPLEFAVSLGFALALVVACGWLLEVRRCVSSRSLGGTSALLLASGGVLLALHLAGMNRGETARLWLFLTPLLVLGAVDFLWRRVRRPGRFVAAVAAAQTLQIVLFGVFLDLGRTSSFLFRHLLPASGP